MGEEMDISEEQAKIMKALEGVSPRWGMKAARIANELYGPPPGHRRLRDGHKICRPIMELRRKGLIEHARDSSAAHKPNSWVLTDKGRSLLKEMEGQEG